MIALIQRVSEAGVMVAGETIGNIGPGIVALIGIEKVDTEATATRLLERILGYRIFADAEQKMNLSLREIGGDLLLVPQFTLAANTSKGMRPSFTSAAVPADGERLFSYLVQQAKQQHQPVATGEFGADMKVSLINDGPVTFWIQVSPPA
jgi:D-tyrosyl-tRNA(Tyr) deacylase